MVMGWSSVGNGIMTKVGYVPLYNYTELSQQLYVYTYTKTVRDIFFNLSLCLSLSLPLSLSSLSCLSCLSSLSLCFIFAFLSINSYTDQ